MMYALVDGVKQPAAAGLVGSCAICQSIMIPKCGQIKVHHWAHKTTATCDPWWEPETEWHRNWKLEFPEEDREVVVGGGLHRADILSSKCITIELQHSPISIDTVRERDEFYRDIIWIFDGYSLGDNFSHTPVSETSYYVKWSWKRPKLSWLSTEKPVYIHLADDTLIRLVWRPTITDGVARGQGRLLTKEAALKELLQRSQHRQPRCGDLAVVLPTAGFPVLEGQVSIVKKTTIKGGFLELVVPGHRFTPYRIKRQDIRWASPGEYLQSEDFWLERLAQFSSNTK